jgi:hypothetical protein
MFIRLNYNLRLKIGKGELVAVFIVVALAAPKFGIMDFSTLLLTFITLYSFKLKQNNLESYSVLYQKGMILFFILFISFASTIFFDSQDFFSTLRGLRALINLVLIYIIFNRIAFSSKSIILLLFSLFTLNSLFIFLQLISNDFAILTAHIYGFDKTIFPLRGFGITAGYDSSGFIALLGVIFSLLGIYYLPERRVSMSLSFLFFISTVVFTSRATILISMLISSIFFIYMFRRMTLVGKMLIFAGFVLLSLLLALFIIPIALNNYLYLTYVDTELIEHAYSSGTGNKWIEMWSILDFKKGSALFGNGRDLPSDIGYIKLLSMSGIVGLSLALIYYTINFTTKFASSYSTKENRLILAFTIFMTCLLFLYNLKSLFFFTRIFHELECILFAYSLSIFKNENFSSYKI